MKNRREFFRKGLNEIYLKYYDALCKNLPPIWQPICGLRTIEEQEKLYAQGRTTKGPIITNSKPGFSFHNFGCASDWGYFTDEAEGREWVPLKFDDPVWREYQEICNKVGVILIEWERPHNELPITLTTRALKEVFDKGGMETVNELIKETMKWKK
jgi:hypothetical protein